MRPTTPTPEDSLSETHPPTVPSLPPPSSLSPSLLNALPYIVGRPGRKRRFFAVVSLLFLASYITIQYRIPDASDVDLKPVSFKGEVGVGRPPSATLPTASRRSTVRGPPTPLFRDNLLPDRQYLTSWPSAGWTNDLMAFGNLIYLALITDRIPVVPKFTPYHISADEVVDDLPFGDVFDVPRLASLIGSPVLEWRDVKIDETPVVETMGCWAVWPVQQHSDPTPRDSRFPCNAGLDVSYTQGPRWLKAVPADEHNKGSLFWDLAKLTFLGARREWLNGTQVVEQTPSPILNVTEEPDQQMLCMDYLFYVVASRDNEYDSDYSPAWRYVVTHVHWTKRLEAIAELYLRSTFGLTPDQPIPPYITIHAKREDFGERCNGVPFEECFASVPAIARRVREVREELSIRYPGMDVKDIIMISDETDEALWDLVEAQGWYRLDHSNTGTRYGKWYPSIIDAVIQSNGMGFVGIDRSTPSTLARRRVRDWQRGVTRSVGADDH